MCSTNTWYIAVLVHLFMFNHQVFSESAQALTSTTENECPPWSASDGTSDNCHCIGVELLLQCFSHNGTAEASLPFCYCLSYNERFDKMVIGHCIVRCYLQITNPSRHNNHFHSSMGYTIINKTSNVTEMNEAYCNDLKMNRTGQLCGSCLEGYTPPVYSYDMACVECSDYKYNWLKYIAVVYLPLTIFCVIIMIVFRTNVTSGNLNTYIMSIQIVTSPTMLRLINITAIKNSGNTFATQLVFKILLTLYGFWNLDFFRLIYTPFCLHPGMTMLETLTLDYAIAVYPLLFVIITYLLVELHDRSPFIMWVWRPFYKCLTRFRAKWNMKSSLIGAFATFILLSYVKILNVSLDLLTTVTICELDGTTIKQLYLAIDPTIDYFGKEHLPYALLALFMFLLFNILPLVLLCVYPCCCFQRCMDHLRLHSHSLHTFIEVFQGSFKTHPRDYRYFAAFYLLLRIINLLLIVVFVSELQSAVLVIIMSIATLIIAVAKPHKLTLHNNIDIGVVLWLIMVTSFFSSRYLLAERSYHVPKTIYYILISIIGIFHPLYGIVVLLSVFVSGEKIKAVFTKIFCNKCSSHRSNDDSLPYRLEHSNEYASLVYTIN